MKLLNISTYKYPCNFYIPKLVEEEERKATQEIYVFSARVVYNYSYKDYLHDD